MREIKTVRWRTLRAAFMAQWPNCRLCGRRGALVDHIQPRRLGGDVWGRIEPTNALQGLPREEDGPGAAPIQPSWRVVLPWPDLRELGGNSDANRYDRARARRVARTDACYTAWDCRPPAPYRHVELRLDFSPPDHRQRDIDNLVHRREVLH